MAHARTHTRHTLWFACLSFCFFYLPSCFVRFQDFRFVLSRPTYSSILLFAVRPFEVVAVFCLLFFGGPGAIVLVRNNTTIYLNILQYNRHMIYCSMCMYICSDSRKKKYLVYLKKETYHFSCVCLNLYCSIPSLESSKDSTFPACPSEDNGIVLREGWGGGGEESVLVVINIILIVVSTKNLRKRLTLFQEGFICQ